MSNENTPYPELNDDNSNRDKKIKDELGSTVDKEDLKYDEEEGSYEIDVESDDPDYVHPDPYFTAVKNGSDSDSDFDEANPTANDEYDRANDDEPDEIDEYGMHVDSGKIVELDKLDEELAETPEDGRGDLDEEGYPKNDVDPGKDGNFL
ncbi:hypothetical protein ADIARSV_0292 [Arcticibacter svalbardensis MN12-7]|uniref:Uncharacterized protein n=1 Tax=Arcticibacter svalbardensis MN12-7 TaxID=1150600 RepID=R9GXW1_9SPHI|nr:hypothetical protein [Arcticibacter svalbardensis]EOR96508.1 hypothetical protein ADIARSV_0292 [Arcticibacter svalbardensis MN12-7]